MWPSRSTPSLERRCVWLEGGNIDRLGRTIERHVDKRGDAARCRGTSRSLKTFPIRAARLVDVNVCVDKARHQHGVAEIRNFRARGNFVPAPHGRDALRVHNHARGSETRWR